MKFSSSELLLVVVNKRDLFSDISRKMEDELHYSEWLTSEKVFPAINICIILGEHGNPDKTNLVKNYGY